MRRALPCLIALASCVPVLAEQVGEIVFIDGRVEVLRNEQTLTEADLAVGAPIENLDRVSTGEGAQVTIAITAPYGAPAEIRIAAKTTFYVEIERMERRSATTLGLITGSIGLKVQKLGGNRSLAVRTDTTVMGVRGTTFDVTTSPAGDVLVSAQEGSVTCSDAERGEEIVAEPGEVVERRVEEDTFRSVPVAVSTLEQFRREWVAERIAVFRSNALRVTRFYAQRYDQLLGQFNDAYDDLMGSRETLAKWVREDREGRIGSRIEVMREKRTVAGPLFRLRRTLFVFERVYFRLAQLEGYYREGVGRGDLRPGLSADRFWARVASDRRELAARLARVRYAIKLYAERNDGEFPGES